MYALGRKVCVMQPELSLLGMETPATASGPGPQLEWAPLRLSPSADIPNRFEVRQLLYTMTSLQSIDSCGTILILALSERATQ
jgi:hypothetical protein